MTRLVRHTNAQPSRGEASQLRPFTDFTDHASLVLLGDPGAGKTHLFKEVAAREHAIFLKARAFLSTPAARLTNEVLFIDGLDEKRGGRGDRDTIDRMVEKLFEVNPRKLGFRVESPTGWGRAISPPSVPTSSKVAIYPFSCCKTYLKSNNVRSLRHKQSARRPLTDFLKQPKSTGLTIFLRIPKT